MKKLLIFSIVIMIFFTACNNIKEVSHTNNTETDEVLSSKTSQSIIESTKETTLNTTSEFDNTSIIISTYDKTEYNEQDLSVDNNITFVNFPNSPDFTSINELINSYNKPCAIYVQSLNDERTFYYNKEEYFYGASLAKLPFVYNCCLEIQKGNYKLDDMVLYEEKYKYGGTGSLQYKPAGDYYSVKQLIEMVLYDSDNTAYNILCHYFGSDSMNKRYKSDGFISEISDENIFCMIKASEMAYYWKMIYLNRETSDAFEVVNHSTMTSKFSPIRIALNSEKWQTRVQSKTGWSENNYHDTGIVLRENPYIVIIMTNSAGENDDQIFLENIANEIDKIMIQN